MGGRYILDDLPVIRENIRKGFLDTQSKVNSWVQNLRKKFENEDEDDFQDNQSRRTPSRSRGSGELSRRSGDRERYDADPQLLSDDFSALELRDGEGQHSFILAMYLLTPYVSSSIASSKKTASKSRSLQILVSFSRQTESIFPGGTSHGNWQLP